MGSLCGSSANSFDKRKIDPRGITTYSYHDLPDGPDATEIKYGVLGESDGSTMLQDFTKVHEKVGKKIKVTCEKINVNQQDITEQLKTYHCFLIFMQQDLAPEQSCEYAWNFIDKIRKTEPEVPVIIISQNED